jgi:anti-sigma factor RsiW
MECRNIKEYFSAYLDGELPEAQAEMVTRHLEVCSACRREYQDWQRLWELLAVEPVQSPVDLTTQILARLPVSTSKPWWRHLALAAALVLGIFVGGKLGIDLYQTTLPSQNDTQLTWEGFEAAPANSLDAMLASYDLENGSGS